jgi:hypothetical protein
LLFLQGGLSRDYISSPSSTAFPVPSLQVLLVFTWDTSKEFDNKFLHLFNASEKEYKFISFLNVILRIKYLSTYLFIMIWFLLQPLLIIKFLTTFFYHTVIFNYWCICFSNLYLTRWFLLLTSEQQPLRLNPAEVQEVIAAVCSEASSPSTNVMTVSTRLGNNSGKPSTDVAVSVLIKLVIDMYDSINCSLCFIHFLFILWLPQFMCFSQFYHIFLIPMIEILVLQTTLKIRWAKLIFHIGKRRGWYWTLMKNGAGWDHCLFQK